MTRLPTEAITEQARNADAYADDARFVSDLGADIVGWLDPKSGERILDLGCGDGALTEELVRSGGPKSWEWTLAKP